MSEYKKCPYCGEQILVEAKKCKYCREWLTEQPQKGASEAETAIPQNEQTFVQPEIKAAVDSESPLINHNTVKEVRIRTHEAFIKTIFSDKRHLDELCIKDGVLTVTTKKGDSLSAPINEIEVGYTESNGGTAYTFKYAGEKLTVVEVEDMLLDDEWIEFREIIESLPNYGLSSLGAIQKACYITSGIVLLVIIAFRLVVRCSS